MRPALRLYRTCLRALPRRVREASGAEMIRTFERLAERSRPRGALALAALTLGECADLLRVGLGERMALAGLPPVRPIVRSLGRRPGYAAAVVVTLALGIGAASSMFAVTDAVAFRALPFPEPERVVHVWGHTPGTDNTIPYVPASSFLAFRELTDVFTEVEGFYRGTRVVTGDGPPEQIDVAVVTPGLLPLFGVRPILGRGFGGSEGHAGDDAYALISHRLWTSRWASDRDVVGRTIELNGELHTVVGVMPRGFAFPEGDADAWLPVAANASTLLGDAGSGVSAIDVVARIRPGLEMEATNAMLERRGADMALAGASAETVPQLFDMGFFTTPERTRGTLVLLLGAVLLVLAVAFANAVALALSQAVDRYSELAVREAMGAGRGRIFVELLTENLVLGMAGGALGLAVAEGVLAGLLPMIPAELRIVTWGQAISVWPQAALPAAGASALVALLMTALTRSPRGAGGRRVVGTAIHADTRGSHRLQQALVAGQMAFAVVLLAGVSLVSASVLRLQRVDTGLDVDRLLAVSLRIPADRVAGRAGGDASPETRAAFFEERFREIEAALRRIEGVEAVAATTAEFPRTSARFRPELETPGRPPLSRGDSALTGVAFAGAQFLPMADVGEGFFEATGVRIIQGRGFRDGDDPEATVVVNRTIAEALWPGGEAVGRTMRVGPRDPWLTVVGVAEPVAQMGLRDQWGNGTEVYVPLDPREGRGYRTFLLRTEDPAALAGRVREAVWGIDPEQPVERLLPLAEAYGSSIGRERFFLVLLGTFAALTTAVAAFGVYALLSRYLARRQREVGIRIALGARPAQVASRVARSSLLPSALGILVGLGAAIPLTRLLGDILFEVEPGDPLVMAAAALTLLAVAVLACVRPAARALRVDVVEAIRGD